jgi:hypothetical protein
MARTRVQKTILGGDPLLPASAAVCSIYHADTTTLAQIYSAREGGVLVSNPVVTGADGLMAFYIDSGRYDLSIGHATGAQTYPDFLGVDEIIVKGPQGALEFETVESMVDGNAKNSTLAIDFADYVGRTVKTTWNNSTSKSGGAEYVIKTLAQAALDGDVIDNIVNHAMNDGIHCGIYKAVGAILYSQAGFDPSSADDSITSAVGQQAASRGIDVVLDSSGALVTTNGNGDFGGARIDLNGNDYRFSPSNCGGIRNGRAILRDTWINGAPNSSVKYRDIDSVYRSTPPVLGPKKRFPIQINEPDVNASLGGDIATWRQCDGSKYWVWEKIITQQSSGSGTSIDTLCPAWRLGELSMCDYVQTQLYTPSAQNGTPSLVNVTAPGLGDVKPNDIKIDSYSSQGDWAEYESVCYDEIGIVFQYTTSGTLDAHIEIFDKDGGKIFDQGDISLKSSTYNQEVFVHRVPNPRPNELVTVRITNRTAVGGSNFMRVGGIGAMVENGVSAETIDNIIYSAFTTGDEKVRSFFNGAMCYAIQDDQLEKFGGESHGGEIMSKQEIRIDGELYTPVLNEIKVCSELRVDQESVTTFPSTEFFNTSSKHRFYSYPAAHDYSASHSFSDGFVAQIAYGPMLVSHSQMDTMMLPERIDAFNDGFDAAGEQRYELGKSEYVRLESSVNPFINEMWHSSYDGQYNESTPWWKIGVNANDARKWYYGPVSSTSIGSKNMGRQPYSTRSVRVYN